MLQMAAAQLAVDVTRIKREECKRTKHDSQFSKWTVLVGPSDWEDHSRGKEGADRYRVHNLPPVSGPGLYELGITISRPGLGRKADKVDSDGVAVVYLGQADDVRTRLQCYGRSGAHLNNTNDGPGYFDDIFSRGYSIVYRWVPLANKADALKAECQLLGKYDYAWNKGCNGKRRHNDVLQKLKKGASNNIQLPETVRKFLDFSQKPVGIKIKASMYPEILKFSKSRPRLLLDKCGANEDNTSICGVSLGDGSVCSSPPVEGRKRCSQHKGSRISGSNPVNNTSICGVSLGDGSVCSSPPVEGRKRCSQHKGSRISGSNPVNLPVVLEKCPVSEGFGSICGVVSNNGSLCRRLPVQGNERCEEHKWRKVNGSNSKSTGTSQYEHEAVFDSNAPSALNSPEMYRPGIVQPRVSSERSATKLPFDTICGVELGGGTFCTRQPVKGRVRCEEHKGLKVDAIKYKSSAQNKSHVYDSGSSLSAFNDRDYCSSVCGAKTLCGSYCRRPVQGNTRCWQHSIKYKSSAQNKSHVYDSGSSLSAFNDTDYCSSVCGATTLCGSYCRRPVQGNTRCWQHSKQVSSYNDWNYGGSSVCGARTRSGSYCRRTVNGGGRCWQH